MTNFDKWMMNPDFGVLSSVFREADNMSCSRCPAKASCPMWNDDMSRGNGTLAQVCKEAFEKWANADTEETKYIVRGEGDVGPCIFCSFWNGMYFEKGEENAKVFDRRESAEEEMNRFGYSPRYYSILTTE